MDNRPVGIFDSGLGGLTGMKQVRKLLPGENIVYFGDTGRIPYGTRGRETILQYARQDISFLLSKDVKFIMAACGTVSSTFPAEEAAKLPVPYLGVVDAAAEAAAAATENCKIGVIGTPATIRSGSFEVLLKRLIPNVEIFTRACPMFVPLVENGYIGRDNPVAKLLVEEYLTDIRAAGVDTVILGCTHFPLLKGLIGDFMGDAVSLIDPGKVTASALQRILRERNMLADREAGENSFYVSDSPEGFTAVSQLFLGQYSKGTIEQIAIDRY